jgi:hypothetical protein
MGGALILSGSGAKFTPNAAPAATNIPRSTNRRMRRMTTSPALPSRHAATGVCSIYYAYMHNLCIQYSIFPGERQENSYKSERMREANAGIMRLTAHQDKQTVP